MMIRLLLVCCGVVRKVVHHPMTMTIGTTVVGRIAVCAVLCRGGGSNRAARSLPNVGQRPCNVILLVVVLVLVVIVLVVVLLGSPEHSLAGPHRVPLRSMM